MILIIDDKSIEDDYNVHRLTELIPPFLKGYVICSTEIRKHLEIGSLASAKYVDNIKSKFKYIFFHQSFKASESDHVIFDEDEILEVKETLGYDKFIGFSGHQPEEGITVEQITNGSDISARLTRANFYENFIRFLHYYHITKEYDLNILNSAKGLEQLLLDLKSNLEDKIEQNNLTKDDSDLIIFFRLVNEQNYPTRIEVVFELDPFEQRDFIDGEFELTDSNYQYQYIK